MCFRSQTIVFLLLGTLLAAMASADTWPGWRGAEGRGVSSETNLPVTWSADANLRWQTNLPGRSNSSPAVTSDRVYVTSQNDDGKLSVLSLDKQTGKIVWQVPVGSGALAAQGPASLYAHRHNCATPSPAADEQNVWAYFGNGILVCVNRDGNVQWRRDLVSDYGDYVIRFGMASSPRLWGDALYIACMTKGPSYVLAVDKLTGKTIWKTDRKMPTHDDGPDNYSSPVILKTDHLQQLLVSGRDHVNAYDPETGEQLWISSGLDIDSPYNRTICSPAVSDHVIVACSPNPPGSNTDKAIALKTGGSGDITQSHRLWEYRPFNPDCSTPVCYRGHVYLVRDDGIASCLDEVTGEVRWRKRLADGTYRAALVAGDGKIYVLEREGLCTVIAAGKSGEVLAENKLPGTFYATPAISDGVIFLHAYGKLYAVGR